MCVCVWFTNVQFVNNIKSFCHQSVLPFFVATKMTKIRKPTLDKPTPERYVAAELTTVGLQDQTNGYFPHAVMVRQPKRLIQQCFTHSLTVFSP